MIVAGTVTWKMAVPLRRLFDQMSEPKVGHFDGGMRH